MLLPDTPRHYLLLIDNIASVTFVSSHQIRTRSVTYNRMSLLLCSVPLTLCYRGAVGFGMGGNAGHCRNTLYIVCAHQYCLILVLAAIANAGC